MATTAPPRHDFSLLTDQDLYLYNEGSHYRIYDKLGAHRVTAKGEPGVAFSVWAPAANEVSVIGNFNDWKSRSHPREPRGSSGIVEGFLLGCGTGNSHCIQDTCSY